MSTTSLHYAAVPAVPWPALETAWQSRLPAAFAERIARLRQAQDRSASLLGLALLEHAVVADGGAFDPQRLERTATGKPVLPGDRSFSISHAAGHVGCAVTCHGAIGLDFEAPGAARWEDLRLVLGADETARLRAGGQEPTEVWVQVEALLKASGRGLGTGAVVGLEAGGGRVDGRCFELRRVSLPIPMVAWLACEDPRAADMLVVQQHEPASFAPLPGAPRPTTMPAEAP